MKGGTLFSGIGSPEFAAPWIDWRWAAEIDQFASAVLAERFPHAQNIGDVEHLNPDAIEPVDIIVFGSPCQSFSVAGKRLGMDDPRGNLALVALGVIERIRPRWLVFENVPGLFSSFSGSELAESEVREGAVGGGADSEEDRDFAAFLSRLRECGYLGCWRVFDAQYAGVPQRRRRVFFVGYLGDWRPAAAVLFEPESLRGDPPPSREAGEGVAPCLEAGANRTGGPRPPGTTVDTADSLIARAVTRRNGGSGGAERDGADTLVVAPTILGGAAGNNNSGHRARSGDSKDSLIIADTVRSHPRPGSNSIGNIAFGGNRQSGPIDVATAVNAHGGPHGRRDFETETFVVPVMAAGAHGANGAGVGVDGDPMFTLDRTAAHAIAFRTSSNCGAWVTRDRTDALTQGTDRTGTVIAFAENSRAELRLEGGDGQIAASLKVQGGKVGQSYPAIAFTERTRADGRSFEAQDDLAYALCNPGSGGRTHSRQLLDQTMAVRRLTPTECERLQGFPDQWTAIRYNGKPAADGPRYRALGNAMAVPVIGWILARIRKFEELGEL